MILLISTTLSGVYLYDKSFKRVKICRELIIFCDCLKRDLMFKSTPINQLADEIISQGKLSSLSFINSDGSAFDTPLESAANKELSLFLSGLGKSDTDTQLDLILSFKEYVQSLLEKYTQSHTKNSKLYLSFGFFFGVVLVIMFI